MDSTEDWDLVGTFDLGPVKTHGPSACAGTHCCVHNPSDHPMNSWPMTFDPQKMYLALRMCPHEYGHPDPDSLRFHALHPRVSDGTLMWMALHQCDGCCFAPDPTPM
jgi:hypothetical protein